MTGSAHLDDLPLDRYLAGELAGAERELVTAHLERCSRCAARFHSFAQLRDSFVTDYPFAEVVGRLPSPARQTPARWGDRFAWFRAWMLGPLVAAAAGFLLVLMIATRVPPDGAAPGRTRSKGEPLALAWYVERSGALVRLWPGQPLWTGDRLQIVASAHVPGYLGVISIDGARQVTVYFPADTRAAYQLRSGDDQRLPSSTVLDEVTGRERLFVVLCDHAFVPAEIAGSFASAAGGNVHHPGCTVTEHTFEKIARPERVP